MKNLILIIGKSASGKNSVLRKLISLFKDFDVIIPYTSRPKRDGEIEGVDYYFKDLDCFMDLINDNKFIEYRKYETLMGDLYYATPIFNSDNALYIGTLDVYKSLKSSLSEEYNIIPVYITLDEDERIDRALRRESDEINPNYAEVLRRINKDNDDFSKEKLLTLEIDNENTFYNNDLNNCVLKISDYINKKLK